MNQVVEGFMEMFKDNLEYMIGDLVYITTDPEQYKRIVIGYELSPNGIIYRLCIDNSVTMHYKCELTRDKIVF